MRSVECPDAAAVGASPRAEEVRVFAPRPAADFAPRPAADFAPRHQGSGRARADSDLALAFALLVQRARPDSPHLLLRAAYSCRGRFSRATTISSRSTVGLDFTIFIIISGFLADASDASRPSSAPDFSGARPSILLTTATTIPITMEDLRRRNRLS